MSSSKRKRPGPGTGKEKLIRQFPNNFASLFSARVGIALLIGSTLLSNLQLFRRAATFTLEHPGRDKITLYEERFEGIKKMLPPQGVVGYISNAQAEDIRFDITAGEYYLTQYALSPLIVDYSQRPKLVVGNFRDPATGVKVAAGKNLILLKDLGNGVMLFSHEDK